MDSIASQLRATRKGLNLSQKQVGAALGMGQGHLSLIESKKFDPRLSSLIQVARYLGLELMLIPRPLVPTVQALLSGKKDDPLWQVETTEPDFPEEDFP
jgi:transcriptional regulator with XRE-family HTH domain